MIIKLINHPLTKDPNFNTELADVIYKYVDTNYGTTWSILQKAFAGNGKYTADQVTISLRYLERTQQVSQDKTTHELTTPTGKRAKPSPAEENKRMIESIQRVLVWLKNRRKGSNLDLNSETNDSI
jgi:hypothetical protein